MSIHNKIVLITGSGRGLGKSMALLFAKNGAKVVLNSRTKSELESVKEQILQSGGTAVYFVADISIAVEAEALIDFILRTYGKIDILINNAGIGLYNPIEKLTEKELDRMLSVNLKGTIFCSRLAYLKMKKLNAGLIINIASIAGKIGLPGESGYCASKFAVVGFTEALAAEAKPYGIRVTAVCPGGINTPFWDEVTENKPDVSRFLDPDDVARMVYTIAESSENCVVNEIILRPMKDRH